MSNREETARKLCVNYLVGQLLVDHGHEQWAEVAAMNMCNLATDFDIVPADFTRAEENGVGWIAIDLCGTTYRFNVDDLDEAIRTEIRAIQFSARFTEADASQAAREFASHRALHRRTIH